MGRQFIAILFAAGLVLGAAAEPPTAAVVNGKEVHVWEAERELSKVVSLNLFHQNISPDRRAALRRKALDALIVKELKLQWANQRGMTVEESEVDALVREVRDKFADKQEFLAALSGEGISEDGLREAIRRDLLADAVDDHVREEVTAPSDEEVKQFFNSHRDEYVVPEARHIIASLVYLPASASRSEREEAEIRARTLAMDVAEGSVSLADDARRVRPTLPPAMQDQVGDLGFVHRGAMQGDANDAVFASEVGETVGPVRTLFGYLVLQTVALKPEHPLPLDSVIDAIAKRVVRERQTSAQEDFEHTLYAAAVIEESAWATGG